MLCRLSHISYKLFTKAAQKWCCDTVGKILNILKFLPRPVLSVARVLLFCCLQCAEIIGRFAPQVFELIATFLVSIRVCFVVAWVLAVSVFYSVPWQWKSLPRQCSSSFPLGWSVVLQQCLPCFLLIAWCFLVAILTEVAALSSALWYCHSWLKKFYR